MSVPTAVTFPVQSSAQGDFGQYQIAWPGQAAGTTASFVFDFSDQKYNNKFKQIQGLFVDNSNSTIDLSITIQGSIQAYTVFAGQVITMPIIAANYPKITVTELAYDTVGTDITNLIFTSFPLNYAAPVNKGSQSAQTEPTFFSAGQTGANLTSTTPVAIYTAGRGWFKNWWTLQNTGANPLGIYFNNGSYPGIYTANFWLTIAAGAFYTPPSGYFTPFFLQQIWLAATSAGSTTATIFGG